MRVPNPRRSGVLQDWPSELVRSIKELRPIRRKARESHSLSERDKIAIHGIPTPSQHSRDMFLKDLAHRLPSLSSPGRRVGVDLICIQKN